jgi:DTW domain-containing protein
MMVTTVQPRAMCSRCRRPLTVCYCSHLTALPTRTRIVILQHPRERDMPIGTARMASLCLPDSELHVGMRWDDDAAVQAALSDPARPAVLLYPDRGAKNILVERPPGPVTLVVVDGTWSQAKTVVRDNKILQALPRYAFVAPEPSAYRIRKEPSAEYVSTIEALMHVLSVLEDEPHAFRALLAPFRAMVDAQLHCQATRPSRRYRQPRGPRPERPRLPAALSERFDDLVCIGAEANAWPYASRAEAPDEIVQLVAVRPSTGERFEQLARPTRALSPSTTFHTELAEAALLAAPAIAELVAAFTRWLKPTDIVAAWGYYGPNLFTDAGGTLGERLDLRALAQQLTNKKLGPLEAYAESLGAPRTPLGDGRGGRRLAALAHVVEHLRATFTR